MTDFLDDPGGFATGRRRRAVGDMPPCNIVVVGKTGVGKSTLVNAVFGEQLAETGVGRPVTPHFIAHTVDGVPVTIVDSRGIELSDDLATVTAELQGELDRRLLGPKAGRLHVLWYCVAAEGARFEPAAEGALLRAVADRLPTFVVLTKAYDAADEGVVELAAFVQSLGLPLKGVIGVLAQPRYGLQPHGLDRLVAATESCLEEGVRRAFVNAQILEIETKLEGALARVEQLVSEQDTAYRMFAFARSAVGRASGDEERYLKRVLDVIAEVSSVFGARVATDERLSALALATLGGQTGASGLANFVRVVNRLVLLIPPVGPTVVAKAGGKLVASLVAAETGNRLDKAARVRAQLASRIYGRAAARVFADAARADVAGEPLSDAEFSGRFERYAEDEAARSAET